MSTDHPIPCPDKDFREPYFPAAKVVMKDPVATVGKDHCIHPIRHCGIITTNGQLWLITVTAFGACEELIRAMWSSSPSLFFRRPTAAEGEGA